MKVLFESFYLYFLGALADIKKTAFDRKIDKVIKKGGDISSPRLTRLSHSLYESYRRFKDKEKDVKLLLTKTY